MNDCQELSKIYTRVRKELVLNGITRHYQTKRSRSSLFEIDIVVPEDVTDLIGKICVCVCLYPFIPDIPIDQKWSIPNHTFFKAIYSLKRPPLPEYNHGRKSWIYRSFRVTRRFIFKDPSGKYIIPIPLSNILFGYIEFQKIKPGDKVFGENFNSQSFHAALRFHSDGAFKNLQYLKFLRKELDQAEREVSKPEPEESLAGEKSHEQILVTDLQANSQSKAKEM